MIQHHCLHPGTGLDSGMVPGFDSSKMPSSHQVLTGCHSLLPCQLWPDVADQHLQQRYDLLIKRQKEIAWKCWYDEGELLQEEQYFYVYNLSFVKRIIILCLILRRNLKEFHTHGLSIQPQSQPQLSYNIIQVLHAPVFDITKHMI